MKLSVCIPTYNRADLLSKTLQSFLPQLTADVEIVVSDNASTDHTAKVVAAFQKQHANVVYHRAPENGGADRNYLKAVELASGEFCWLFGDDDYAQADSVAAVRAYCEQGFDIHIINRVQCDMTMSRIRNQYWLFRSIGDRAFDFSRRAELRSYFNCVQSVGGIFSFLGSIIVRRSAWNAVQYEDRFTGTAYSHAFILLSLAAGGCRLSYHREPLVDCRFGNDSFATSGVARRMMIDMDGYGAIREALFADDPQTASAMNGVLCREYPWWRLARRRLQMSEEDWQTVSDALRCVDYSRSGLWAANVLSGFSNVVNVLLSCKRLWEQLPV